MGALLQSNNPTLVGRFENFVSSIKDLKNIKQPHLFFKSGVFEGRNVIVKSDTISLGSNQENNIVLVDKDFPGKALNLNFSNAGFRDFVKINTFDNSVVVDERTKIPPNTSYTFKLPIQIDIGNQIIKIGYKIPKFNNLGDIAKALAVAGLCTVALHFYLSESTWFHKPSNMKTAQMIPIPSIPLETKKHTKPFLGEDVKTTINNKVRDLNFSKYIKLTEVGENNYRIDGILPISHSDGWYDFEKWLDQNSNGLFIQRKVAMEDMATIDKYISGIIESNNRILVISKAGKLLNLGDEIWNEWKISKITKTHIEFKKQGITWTVKNGNS